MTGKSDSQLDKFKKAAREAECNPSEKAFNESLKGLAKSKPPATPKKKPDEKPSGK